MSARDILVEEIVLIMSQEHIVNHYLVGGVFQTVMPDKVHMIVLFEERAV
jgi:hypothetical protein